MQLVDRIEKRRFVGREFLLWMWFESELLDATVSTRAHGEFGLWLEKRLLLSAGKQSTRITAQSPGLGREAKEALLAGQLPESAGIRIARGEDETGFQFNAERFAIAGLKLNTVLDQAPEQEQADLVAELKNQGAGHGRSRSRKAKERDEDIDYEKFYERMRLTQEIEALVEALYQDFLALRLSDAWARDVVPRLQAWAQGEEVDAQAYRAAKKRSTKPIARTG
jgi:hypothetical protein